MARAAATSQPCSDRTHGLGTAFPGAVVGFDSGLVDFQSNPLGAALMAAQGDFVRAAAARVQVSGETQVLQCSIPPDAANRALELTVLLTEDDTVLVLGRDNSLEIRIRDALIESRRRYQDLVAISGDFAWETDDTGAFIFVSPTGALGYAADELIGRDPLALTDDCADPDAVSCFSCKAPVQGATVWLRGAGSAVVCLETSALPVLDKTGAWRGARGTCRDVTAELARATELADARLREETASYIGGRMRDEAHPADMLNAAVKALGRALGAAAAVYRVRDGLECAATHGAMPDAMARRLPPLLTPTGAFEGTLAGLRLLACSTSYQGSVNGALVVARDEPGPDWVDNDRQILDATARQMGIALRQIGDQQELERLSRTDGLTGLLNRRAFLVELERSLRNARPGALIYIDLDNFKSINDQLGHAEGDRTLVDVAGVLSGQARGYDLAARLGGDEFALWLDGVRPAVAERRANRILGEIEALTHGGAPRGIALSASIGIAARRRAAAGEDMAALVARADAAMYSAKHAGKGRIAVAADTAVAA